jgi:predicted nucleic acid-binding protein
VRILLDTIVLLRLGNRADPSEPSLLATHRNLLASCAELCVCAQSLVELWAALTRQVNAKRIGLEPAAARQIIDELLQSFRLLPAPFRRWIAICSRLAVLGRQACDARIAAVRESHGITHLFTLNAVDFKRYPGLVLLSPRA